MKRTSPSSTLYLFLPLLLLLTACTDGGRYTAVLNRAQQQNLSYDSITGVDSIILAAAFFDRHGTPNEQMTAHYLLGCAYRDMEEAPAALQSFQHAADCADTMSLDCDYRRLMSIHGQMAEIFHSQNLPDDELEERERCWRCAQQLNDTLMLIRCVELKAKPYFLMKDTVSLISTLLQAQQLYANHGYYHEANAVYPPLIDLYIGQDSITKAKEMMDAFESSSGLFDADGMICPGREGYYELKANYYLKVHQTDSAEFNFRRLLRRNTVSNSAEAYKGLLSVYNEKEDLDSVKKYILLFEQAVYKERADIQTHAIHQIHSLYNYQRSQEKANAESRKAERIRFYLMLSLLMMVIIIILAFTIFIHLVQKKKKIRDEAEMLRLDFITAIKKKDQTEKELEILKASYAQLIESEETTRNTLADVRANDALLIAGKEKEIAELNKQINEYTRHFLSAGNRAGVHPQLPLLIDSLHRKAARKKNSSLPAPTEWKRLVCLFALSQPTAYAAIGREDLLSPQELKACILLLQKFSNSEIISLLDISPQRMTNIRTNINDKLFKEANAHSLDRNLGGIPIV